MVAMPDELGAMEALANEAMLVRELGELMFDPVYRGRDVPRGDGRHVLVLPGLFANDMYLQPLRAWLRRVGYRPVRSTLQVNIGCPQRLTEQIEEQVERHRRMREGSVAIIGHSRGGILGTAIASRLGDDCSHLVLLGSPVGALLRLPGWGAYDATRPPASQRVQDASTRARRMLDPNCNVPECGCPFPQDLRQPLSVKTKVTSIYSADDPIVPAWACPVEGADCHEVRGTHSGLAYNRAVYRILGEALAS
jgi:pimeloyl-ACP methyl ester carboxylesterase